MMARMKPSVALTGLVATLLVCPPAKARDADPRNGQMLAQQTCADCHAIRPQEDRSPVARAPTFQELATTPGMNTTALSVALTTPHAGMPMFKLTAEQAADVIAYILSLR